ncbi:MAG: AIM24 family protein [Phycisphaerales bacterium]
MSTPPIARPTQTIAEFVSRTTQRDRGHGVFELESDRILELNLDGRVWMRLGTMIAHTGDVRFTREGMLEHGIGRMLKRAIGGESMPLAKAEGRGTVYLADRGKKVVLLQLAGDAIVVNGNDVLAFQETVRWDMRMMKGIATMLAGGLFNVRFEGHGIVAVTSHHDPLTLRVTPDRPVSTDPNATILWSGNLEPELKTDMSFRTLLGRGGGEALQMHFRGDGFVVVQPHEEGYAAETEE